METVTEFGAGSWAEAIVLASINRNVELKLSC